MDTPCPRRENELSDIERRLSAWQPAADDLHPDAMLFAAGQAAGRRSRAALLWPAACVLLALQAVGLGVWGLQEHSECQALASRLAQRGSPVAMASLSVPVMPEYTPSPNDYFHLRQRVDQDLGRELAFLQPQRPQAPGPPPPGSAILTAGQRDLTEQ